MRDTENKLKEKSISEIITENSKRLGIDGKGMPLWKYGWLMLTFRIFTPSDLLGQTATKGERFKFRILPAIICWGFIIGSVIVCSII